MLSIISSADVEDGLEVGVTGCTAAAVALLAAGLANTCLYSWLTSASFYLSSNRFATLGLLVLS